MAIEKTNQKKIFDSDNELYVHFARSTSLDASSIYISPIWLPFSQEKLKEKFSIFGQVVGCRIEHFLDSTTGHAFVDFEDSIDARTAIELTNGSNFLDENNEITVRYSFNGKSSKLPYQNNRSLFVGGIKLPYTVDDLVDKFLNFGSVEKAQIFSLKNSSEYGFALIEFG